MLDDSDKTIATDEIVRNRLEICKLCEKFTEPPFCAENQINIIVNVTYEQQTCPLNKW